MEADSGSTEGSEASAGVRPVGCALRDPYGHGGGWAGSFMSGPFMVSVARDRRVGGPGARAHDERVDIDAGGALRGPHDALGHVRGGQRGLDARVDGIGGGPVPVGSG